MSDYNTMKQLTVKCLKEIKKLQNWLCRRCQKRRKKRWIWGSVGLPSP